MSSRENKFNTFSLWITFPVGMLLNSPKIKSIINKQREKDLAKEKQLVRNFKIEIKQGLLFNRTKYIQRDKPLTDEELNIIYSDGKS